MLVTEKVLGPVDDPVAQQVVLTDLSVVPLVPWGVLIVLYVCLGVLELLFVVCCYEIGFRSPVDGSGGPVHGCSGLVAGFWGP